MRAAIVTTPGSADAIEIIDAPEPAPDAGEVVIEVEAASVNPVDLQTRSGVYHKLGWVKSPTVGLGWDASGTITAVGPEVRGLNRGDRVAVLIGGVDRSHGAYAQRVAVPAADVARVPDALSLADAATVPLNATTASMGLDLLGPAADRSLLVTGAAGAVGGFAVELAVRRGFTVTGLARGEDQSFVHGAGARFVSELYPQERYDTAFDAAAIGDPIIEQLRDAGSYVGVIPVAVPEATRGIEVQAVMATPDGALLARLLTAASDGELTTRVHSALPLEQAADAHRRLERGGVRGRIILTP